MRLTMLALASLPLAVLLPHAAAQTYPVKPLHVIVGFVAGGSADTTARLIAQKLSENLGQPVVVENRLGAGSSIAIERVTSSAPDGYTLLVMTASGAALPALQQKLPFNLERDLAPVSLMTTGTFVFVVHPSVPARNVKEMIALAKAAPAKLSYGSSGINGAGHIAGVLFNSMAGIETVHVPYKGSPETALAVATGQVDMAFPDTTAVLPLLRSGKLKAIAVTSAKRSPLLPGLPTISESGLPGYDRSPWNGMLAPARTPPDIVAKLNATIVKVLSAPEMKAPFNNQGLEPRASTPGEFGELIRREVALNVKLIALAGAQSR